MGLSQTTLILICFVLLVYIAFIITISYTAENLRNVIHQYVQLDSALSKFISTGAELYPSGRYKQIYIYDIT